MEAAWCLAEVLQRYLAVNFQNTTSSTEVCKKGFSSILCFLLEGFIFLFLNNETLVKEKTTVFGKSKNDSQRLDDHTL